MFESGAIVLQIAERSEALMPRDAAGRARATTWVLAALNSVEPAHMELATIDFFHPDAEWAAARRPEVERSEEHTSELQSLMRSSYAVFCLKKKYNNVESST